MSLRKAIPQQHRVYPILFRLDFLFPLICPQKKQKTQKLLSLSLHPPSFPNNPWHKALRNKAASPFPQQQPPKFFSGTRISFRLSKQNEYTVRPKTAPFKKHQPTSVPPEDLLELDRDSVAEHLKVGIACWISSCCFSDRDCRKLYSVRCVHTLWGSSQTHLNISYELKILIQQNIKMFIRGWCTKLMGCTNLWLFEDELNQVFIAEVENWAWHPWGFTGMVTVWEGFY